MAKKSRKKGTGNVRFRKDIKRWVIDFYDKQHVRHQEITLCVSQDEAIAELEKKRSLMFLGLDQPVGSASKASPLFKDYVDEWYKRREADGLAESTLRSYQGIIENHLKCYFGNMELAAITRSDVKQFVTEKKEGTWDKRTLRHVFGVLKQVLSEAEDDELISSSPFPKVRLLGKAKKSSNTLSGDNAKMKCLELHEIPIFLNACSEEWYPLFYTFIFAGLRRGEALGLKWKDIDFDGQQINVERSIYKGNEKAPKTENSRRSIDIGPRHVEILKKHRAKRIEALLKMGKQLSDEDFVFSQANGQPLDPDNLYKRVFRKILDKTGLHCDIHGLRHTFASLLIASKQHNLKYIQDQLGHANISMTMDTYGHLLKVSHEGSGKRTEDWFNSELTKCQVVNGAER